LKITLLCFNKNTMLSKNVTPFAPQKGNKSSKRLLVTKLRHK